MRSLPRSLGMRTLFPKKPESAHLNKPSSAWACAHCRPWAVYSLRMGLASLGKPKSTSRGARQSLSLRVSLKFLSPSVWTGLPIRSQSCACRHSCSLSRGHHACPQPSPRSEGAYRKRWMRQGSLNASGSTSCRPRLHSSKSRP